MIVSVGDLATDVVVRLGTHDIDPVSDTPAAVSLHRGGAAANVAAVSARLGRPARFVGALGPDALAATAASALAELGVDVVGPTAVRGWSIVVLVDPDGHRRFLTDTGEVDRWPAPDASWLDGARRLHLSGYAIANDRSADACVALAAEAGTRGIARSVDVCSASVVRAWGVDRFVAALAAIAPDVVKVNSDELAVLADGDRGDDALVDAVAPGGVVVATAGAAPTRLWTPGDPASVVEVEVPPVSVVDSTGAGDAFVAGFLAAHDGGAAPATSVVAGHRAAARVVTGVGADAWQDGADV